MQDDGKEAGPLGHKSLRTAQAHAATHALGACAGEKMSFHKRCSVQPQGWCPSAERRQVKRRGACARRSGRVESLCLQAWPGLPHHGLKI